jgi:hypothetical protein
MFANFLVTSAAMPPKQSRIPRTPVISPAIECKLVVTPQFYRFRAIAAAEVVKMRASVPKTVCMSWWYL